MNAWINGQVNRILDRDRISLLTASEKTVLQAMAKFGYCWAAAEHLCISKHTVRTHLRNARVKLGVHTTLQAVLLLKEAADRDTEPNS